MTYNIKPKPTLYKGRLYRSRLEARWASMFDRFGWSYEYEPFDLPGWSPDFAIKGKRRDILVEVKPEYLIDEKLKSRIELSTRRTPFAALILNEKPFVFESRMLWIGEVMEYDYRYWSNCYMKCYNDMSSHEGLWDGLVFEECDREHFLGSGWGEYQCSIIQTAWQLAGNDSMFIKPKSR